METKTDAEFARLQRKLEREREARLAAEELLESKSAELFETFQRFRLEASRSQALTDAAEAAADGIALTDPQGIFTYMNLSHARLFGYEPHELIGKPWSVLYTEEMAAELGEVAIPVVFGEGSWRGDVKGLAKNGDPVEQEVALTARPRGEGLICITRDARERLAREARMRELERKMRTSEKSIALYVLSNTVAHDLGNLVAIIEGNATVLEATLPDGQTKERIRKICTATGAAREVLRSLETGVDAEMIERRPVDLSTFLTTTLGLLEAIKPRGVAIEAELPRSAPAQVNEMLLSRSVLNIIKNAFEAMGDHGTLKVRLKAGAPGGNPSLRLGPVVGDPEWQIEIEDDGPGFPSEDLERFFTPFASTKKRTRFSGLGLLSVNALAESRGATVEIDTSPGRGTLFRILIPRTAPVPARSATRTRLEASVPRVLIVEDEAEIGEALRARLEAEGYSASFLSDPVLARQVLSAGSGFDLVITDLNMPKLAGDALAREVRETRPDLPFMLISSQAGFLTATDLFVSILSKPINYEELLGAVADIVR